MACEEILPGRNGTPILDLFMPSNMRRRRSASRNSDKGERKAWMERTKKQLDAGRVAQIIVAL